MCTRDVIGFSITFCFPKMSNTKRTLQKADISRTLDKSTCIYQMLMIVSDSVGCESSMFESLCCN